MSRTKEKGDVFDLSLSVTLKVIEFGYSYLYFNITTAWCVFHGIKYKTKIRFSIDICLQSFLAFPSIFFPLETLISDVICASASCWQLMCCQLDVLFKVNCSTAQIIFNTHLHRFKCGKRGSLP